MSMKSRTTEGKDADRLPRLLRSKPDGVYVPGMLIPAPSCIRASKEPEIEGSGVYRRLTGETSGDINGREAPEPDGEGIGARSARLRLMASRHSWMSVSDSGSVAESSPSTGGTSMESSRESV